MGVATPVPSFVITTFAPGIAPPEESRTDPEIWPVDVNCANELDTLKKSIRPVNRLSNLNRIGNLLSRARPDRATDAATSCPFREPRWLAAIESLCIGMVKYWVGWDMDPLMPSWA